MADVAPILETQGLKCHFGGLKAVDGIDFRLREGEIRAIIGPNGAGKTTFVSLLSGRTPVTSGTIRFRGEDITRMPAFKRVRHGIAYTFQITNIYQKLTVAENVRIAVLGRMQRDGSADLDDRRETAEALRAVGLSDRAQEKAGELAYGHQRLVEVAMGLALRPSVLILDEPTQGLSDSEIEDFCALVREIARTATILLIEHNMDVVMQLADRITVLNRGKLLAEGTPAEIRANAEVQAAYLGTGA
ncbi:ABC transporter ATP-binding protein [Rhizobium sp. KVB221]|uniref:ABC transporter ATP-binding protein n=1 Tax=Rhizobium setariae TaxID=2801340 RepID=A0A937CPX1_9HYPH|nr:ABC transporter ATP-binding protein [Rhizobium setariae]MBL0373689.1 ABC transporter ATP-binding protein [Rhizobium setariae]